MSDKVISKKYIDLRFEFDEIQETWEYNGEKVTEAPYLELAKITRIGTDIEDPRKIFGLQESLSQSDFAFIDFPVDIINTFSGDKTDYPEKR